MFEKIKPIESDIKKNIHQSNPKRAIIIFLNRIRLVIALVVLGIIFSILSPYFFTAKNFIAIGLTVATVGIVSIGQSLCILSRGFDLSVGSTAALAGAIATWFSRSGVSALVSILIGLGVGLTVGAINGLAITKLKINPLITTIAMMQIVLGLAYLVTKGMSITTPADDYRILGTFKVLSIPLPIIVLIVLYGIFFVLLKYSIFGRYIYGIGGNPESAELSGVNVAKIKLIVYMLSGTLAALGGIVLSARLGSASTQAGSNYPFDSISAVVLGGMALSGGVGNILLTFIGVAIIGFLFNGVIILNLPAYFQYMASGAILMIAVFIDRFRKNEI